MMNTTRLAKWFYTQTRPLLGLLLSVFACASWAVADLRISSLMVLNQPLQAGQKTSIRITVVNRGTVAVHAGRYFNVDLSEGSTALATVTFVVGRNGLGVGRSMALDAPWTAVAGTHTIKALIGVHPSQFAEYSANNTGSLTVSVGPGALPDLKIQSFMALNQPWIDGQSVGFRATVQNAGNASVPAGKNFTVSLSEGATSVGSISFNSGAGLAPGSSMALDGAWRAVGGAHTINAVVLPPTEFSESDASNNSASTNVVVTESTKPDLVVSSVTGLLQPWMTGQNVGIRVTVKNQGSAAIAAGKNFSVQLLDGSNALTSIPFSSGANGLAIGASMALDGNWTAAAGTHTLKATILNSVDFTESDYENNSGSATISVGGAVTAPLPDLVISSLMGLLQPWMDGQNVGIRVTVNNQGAAPLAAGKNFAVQLFDGANSIGTVAFNSGVGGIGIGQSMAMDGSWHAVSGTHNINAKILASGEFSESSSANNTSAVNISVQGSTTVTPVDPVAPIVQGNMPIPDSAFPPVASQVSGTSFAPVAVEWPAIGGTLQSALDTYHIVRLAIGARAQETITMSSNQQLYGIPGTAGVSRIRIAPGATGVVVSGIGAPGIGLTLEFPKHDAQESTRLNIFKFLFYPQITAQGARLESNLFYRMSHPNFIIEPVGCDLNGANCVSGWLRNNRFVDIWSQASGINGSPTLSMNGDGTNSYGNVFLSLHDMTSAGAWRISGQGDVTVIGLDAESWVNGPAYMSVQNTGSMRLFSFAHPSTINGSAALDIGARDFQMWGSMMGNVNPYQLYLRSSVNRASLIDYDERSISNAAAFTFRQFSNKEGAPGGAEASVLSLNERDALKSLIMNSSRPARASAQSWGEAIFDPIADPLGGNWQTARNTAQDDTNELQAALDAGIAVLKAKTYYISHPLYVNTSESGALKGLVGAGPGRTVILAKTNDFPMIVPRYIGSKPLTVLNEGGRMMSMLLTNLTLQGGRIGVLYSKDYAGGNAQYSDVFMSYLTIRDMSEAGIAVDQIYAWDNNSLDHLNIVNSNIAFRQRGAPNCGATGGVQPCSSGDNNPYLGYIDKVSFFQSQFINSNGSAFDLVHSRANNANAWINCKFENNRGSAIKEWLANFPVIVGSVFINNGGTADSPTVMNSGDIAIVGSRFNAGQNGHVMLGYNRLSIEGTTFERGGSTDATIFGTSRPGTNHFFHSKSDMPVGSLAGGTFMNSRMNSDADYNQRAVVVRDGRVITLIPEDSDLNPVGQLLMGSKIDLH